MARPMLFTRAVIKQIAPWVRDGADAAEIARRVGCTVGTLRVRGSQLGMSLKQRLEPRSSPRNQPSVAPADMINTQSTMARFQMSMAQPFMNQFEASARARGLSTAALAQVLLEVIVRDGLYEAVLDEGSSSPQGIETSILRD